MSNIGQLLLANVAFLLTVAFSPFGYDPFITLQNVWFAPGRLQKSDPLLVGPRTGRRGLSSFPLRSWRSGTQKLRRGFFHAR